MYRLKSMTLLKVKFASQLIKHDAINVWGSGRIAAYFLSFWQQKEVTCQIHVVGTLWAIVCAGRRAGGTVRRSEEKTTATAILNV
jgi:hypothetical protein